MLTLSTIPSRPLRWLWPNRIALGKVTLFLGPTGAGKSLVTLDMAARVSSGKSWPNAPNEENEPGGVLLLTGDEDLSDTVRPRLEAAGANLDRIQVIDTNDADNTIDAIENQPLTLPENIQAIEDAIKNTPECRLVIIDPLSDYLPQTSPRKQPPLKAILKPLNDLAARTGVAIVAVMPILQSTSKATMQRAVANLTAQAAPYSVWQLIQEEPPLIQEETPPAPSPLAPPPQHYLLPVRNNQAPPNTALAFQPQPAPNGAAQVGYRTPCVPPAPPITRRRPAKSQPKNRSAANPLFNSELRTPHSELPPDSELRIPHSEIFADDPDPYEGIPSLHDYLDIDDLDYPKPMNLHPPGNR